MNYTIVKSIDEKSFLRCSCKQGYAVKELYGFCEVCWIKLSEQDREVLFSTSKINHNKQDTDMGYTTLYNHDGQESYCTCGKNYSIKEYYGFCEVCWLGLKPKERALLKGVEVVAVKPKFSLAKCAWNTFVSVAVVLMLYSGGYLDYSMSRVHHFSHKLVHEFRTHWR